MTIKNLDQLNREIAEGKYGKFRSAAHWDKAGDCIFFFREEAAHIAERVDSFLTVYRSRKDRSIVGIQLKSVSRIASAIEKRTGEVLRPGADFSVMIDEILESSYPGSTPIPRTYYKIACGGFVHTKLPKLQCEDAY